MKRPIIFALVLLASNFAYGFIVTGFSPGTWPRTDGELGVTGFVIEDFENVNLAPGLLVQISDSTDNYSPTNQLAAAFDPAVNDPNGALVFASGVWDGTQLLLNRRTPPPSGYLDFAWGDTSFIFPTGATSVGFSVQNMDLTTDLFVNGVNLGTLNSRLPAGSGRNGYVRIDAGTNEVIYSVRIANTTSGSSGDGLAFDHLAFQPAPVRASSVYFNDFESGAGPEWSPPSVEASASETFTKFLGRFGNDGVRLILDNLIPGAGYLLEFDFYATDSWDGNGSADYFTITVDNRRIFDETFSNYNGDPPQQTQTFPGQPEGGRVHRAFSAEWVDAIHRRVRVPFTPQFATATIHFFGRNLEDIANEACGLDNLSVTPLACVPAPTNLVSLWPANLSALDAHGTNHGALHGGAGYAPGIAGEAFRFNGGADHAEVPDGPALNFGPNAPMSAELWVYRTSSSSTMHFFGKRTGCGIINYQMALDLTSGAGLAFGSYNGGVSTGADLPMNRWTHLAATFDGGTYRFYIDGVLRGTGSGSMGPVVSDPLRIGNSGTCEAFGGLIDELAIYNRALAAEEIQAIYAAGGGGRCSIFPRITNPGVPAATLGVAYSTTLFAQQGTPPYRFNLLSGALPAGITLNTNGLLSGAPTAPGNFNFTVIVTDAQNRTGQRTFTIQAVQCAPTPAGLVHAYPGETNANDSIGTVHGTPQNGTAFAPGKIGNAFSFDGANDYVDLGNWFNLQVFSVSMWVKAKASQQGYADIIDNNHTDTRSWVIQYANSGLGFIWGVAQRGSVGFNLTADTWQHLAVSYDSNYVGRLYLDGVQIGSFQGNGPVLYDGSQFLRLSAWGGGGRHFNGEIDEVEIYDRALTLAEVQSLHAADHAGRCETPCVPPPANLISWWPAENNANDRFGANHGTLQNGASFAAGKVGQAFSLNGANQHVLIGDPIPPSLQIQNEITLSAWIYVTAYPADNLGLIVGSQYDAQQAGATIFLDGRTSPDGQPAPPGHIHFQIGDGSWHTANANAQVPLNQWVHIAATRKANEDAKIYYNGVLQPSTSLPWPGAISYNGAWFAIGQQKDISRAFNGLVDEPAIYDRALSPAEIQAVASAGSAGMCVPSNPSDLAITTVLSGGEANAGVPFPVIFTLTNRGPNAATGIWTNTIVLTDNLNGTNLQPIARLPFNGTLAAGASITFTQSVIIPASFTGDYVPGVLADSANQIAELNEANNLTFSFPGVHIRAPDLVLDSVSTPTSAQLGATIELHWSAHNAGDTAAFANWNDVVYLTTNASTLVGATVLASRSATDIVPMPASAAYVRTQFVTLPLNTATPAGTYFLVFRVDAANTQPESNEGNNEQSRFITLIQPPLPDLLVTNVASSDFVLPGQSISVRWTITNGGAATVSGTWNEAVLLRHDSIVQPDQLLQTFAISNTLAPGAFLSRTQTVMLPLTNTAGLWRIVVGADVDNAVLEQTESNNFARATNTLTLPATLRLVLPVSRVLESASNVPIRCVLARNAGLESNLVVTLSASHGNELLFPPQVNFAAGQSFAVFDIFSMGDGIADGDRIVRLSAAASNYFGGYADITVADIDMPKLHLDIIPTGVAEGQTAPVMLTREPVTTNDLMVLLISSSQRRLTAPSSIVITANQATVMFAVAAGTNNAFEGPQVVSLTATAPGFLDSPDLLTITDDDAPVLGLTLAGSSVSEGAGGVATMATLTRSPVTDQPLTLALNSSATSAAVVQPTVTIGANEASASFAVGAVNDGAVDGTQVATLTATVINPLNGESLGISTQATLNVLDDDGPALALTLNRTVAAEGLAVAAQGTVTRNTSTSSNLIVSLNSGDTSEATVPPTVTILAGAPSATFDIATVNDGISDGNQNVTIGASASAFSPGSARLVVSDVDLPDLMIAGISAPSNALNDATIQVTFTIANRGIAAFNGTTIQRVLLSRDRFVGDDIVLGNFDFTGALAVGGTTTRMVPIRVPEQPGDYWIVAVADATGLVSEGLEDNNTSITAAPLHIAAAYSATVQTSLTVAPAGTPAPLNGNATLAGGGAAASVPVRIFVDVNGTRRTLTAMTDANGQFASTFYPLSSEAGHYQIAAVNPGVTNVASQDDFTLLGMRAMPPRSSHSIPALTRITNTVELMNLSDMPVSGISAALIGANGAVSIQITTPATLNGSATNPLTYTIESTADIGLSGTFVIRLTSAEGVTLDVPIDLAVSARQPRLTLMPGSISGGMVRGQQTLVEFEIRNDGGKETGPIQVNLPDVPWMHVANTLPLVSLNPGESNRVTLQLMPAVDAPLIQQNGSIIVSSPGAQSTLPFSFNTLSTALGDLRVTVEDEFTFYAVGSPKLSNATVTVSDAITGIVITNGVTGTNGVVFWGAMREGYYNVDVNAEKHSPFRKTVLVTAGRTNELTAFLSRQTVQYLWTVVPTEIEDRTRIHIETVFETVVPIPVITIEPSLIDLADIQGDIAQVDLKISNHGLIAANGARIRFGTHPNYQIQPLASDLGSIPAQGMLTVPVLIRKLTGGGAGKARAKDGVSVPCTIGGGVDWSLVCGGNTNEYSAPVSAINAGNCTVSIGGSPVIFDSVPAQPVPPSYQELNPIGPIPNGNTVPYSCGSINIVAPVSCEPCDEDNFEPEDIFSRDLSAFFSPLEVALEAAIQAQTGPLVSPDVKLEASGGLRTCCNMGNQGMELFASATAGLDLTVGPLIEKSVSLNINLGDGASANVEGSIKAGVAVTGGVELSATVSSGCSEFDPELSGSASAHLGFFAGLQAEVKATATAGPFSGQTQPASISGNLQGNITVTISYANGQLTTRVCSEGVYIQAGGTVFGQSFYPLGAEKVYIVDEYCPQADVTTNMSREEARKVWAAFKRKYAQRAVYESLAVTNGALSASSSQARGKPDSARSVAKASVPQANEGVCARVRLRLDQDLVMTRSAFNATLELVNSDPSINLSNIFVEVNALDLSGNNANDKFGIRPPVLRGLNAVDGSGTLGANGSGSASWILIPNNEAAPNGPTEYTVSGLLTYMQEGRQVVVPLLPVPITVFPDARLKIKYFHERDVFSDDPFTPLIEPAVPYSLGVLVQNVGKGAAKNVKIISAQPQIVDNEKGLLIDFKIIGAQVGNQNVTPSLTVNLGNIASNSAAVGRWLFQSSLHGQFIDYSASFEHVDSLGDPRLSLVESVEIHEMIHVVSAGGVFNDGLPDFLVNDIPNGENLPDTLYLSDGRILPVNVVLTGTPDGPAASNHLQVVLTTSAQSGWRYLRVPDPGNGRFRLTRVLRSDGLDVPLDSNAWITDRTFIENSRRPINEFNLHLFDYDSTGSYTLYYEIIPSGTDTTAPNSSITPLNQFSTRNFAVSWNGTEELGGSGVASFDVFVSSNGGPFTVWLQETHVTAGIFNGVPGNQYAFYSVATDAAGNREAPPEIPDAETSVTGNTAPVIDPIANATINEGDTFSVVAHAVDSDVPANALTYSLAPGAPQGMVLNPISGALTWVTGETHGPGTYPIRVYATDDGQPSLLATQDFVITVRETNAAPVLPAIGSTFTIIEGNLLTIDLHATDIDLPANPLQYSLSNAPSGAAISGSGILSWLPSEAQGGTAHIITARVSDNGTPPLTDSRTFTVIVSDTNSPPVLARIPDYLIYEGSSLVLTARVTDIDVPTNQIAFTLDPGAPAGAVIHAWSGVLTWTPGDAQIPTTNVITVRATDNGVPVLDAVTNFIVRAELLKFGLNLPKLLTNRTLTFLFKGDTGHVYQVQASTNLSLPTNWQPVLTFTATNKIVPLMDTNAPQYERRFYRAVQTN